MERFFNTAGPVNQEDHYCLPLEKRLDVEEIPSPDSAKKVFCSSCTQTDGKNNGTHKFSRYFK